MSTKVFQHPDDMAEFLILSMASSYGAPADAGRSTPWHLVGTEAGRLDLFEQVEDFAAISISDDQRERVRTLGDLIDLATQGRGV